LAYILFLRAKGISAPIIGGTPSLEGYWTGYPPRSLPPPGIHYDWNHVMWHFGDPANFPLMRMTWTPGLADLVAASPAWGVVVYWFEPTDASSMAYAVFRSEALVDAKLKKPYGWRPVTVPTQQPQPAPPSLPNYPRGAVPGYAGRPGSGEPNMFLEPYTWAWYQVFQGIGCFLRSVPQPTTPVGAPAGPIVPPVVLPMP